MGTEDLTRPTYQQTPFSSSRPLIRPQAPSPASNASPALPGTQPIVPQPVRQPPPFQPYASAPPSSGRFPTPPLMPQAPPPLSNATAIPSHPLPASNSGNLQRYPTPPILQAPSGTQFPLPAQIPSFAPIPMGSPPLSSQVLPQGQTSLQPPAPPPYGRGSPFPQPPIQGPSMAAYPTGVAVASPPPQGRIGMNAASSLAEDFSFLSLGSVPGSMDPGGLDPKALPRPLNDKDITSKNLLDPSYEVNCDSRYVSLTTKGIPCSQSLASRWHLPLGAVVCPLATPPDGEEVPVVNSLSTGIIRCRRCRTYINPFVTFTDSGRKWRCNICALLNDVPGEYFAHLDATGRRTDLDLRPELRKGSVEFIAPAEYMVRPPMPPLYFFLIDVSISAARSGMLEVVSKTIKSCLDSLPGYPRTQIGFITYDSTIHFYNMKSILTQPQMMVVSDLDDIFVPLPDDLLVNLSESRNVVDAFLDSLPSMFRENTNLESAFGPALKSASMIMNPLGGKLLIFQNTMPSIGIGRLKVRGDDPRVYGTDREYTLRVPEDPFYKQMAADLTKYQIGVNVYAFSEKYSDVASLGTLAKYTGGDVYYYPNFQAAQHGDKLHHELTRDLTRETGWEAVMRVRCGKGIRFSTYHGNFMLRSTDLLALPAVDCDKAYGMVLCLEETLLSNQVVYFQVALLYTASCGERRIRVHTAAAPVVTDLSEMYRLADTPTLVSVMSRLAVDKTYSSKLEESRSAVQQKIVKALREYRNLHAVQHRLVGQMIYPESLKFLALYALALAKAVALRGGADVPLDRRCSSGFTIMALPSSAMMKLLYPSLIRVDEYLLQPSMKIDDLSKVPLTIDGMDSRGIYVFDDGLGIVIWFGRMMSPDLSMNLLGQDAAADLSTASLALRDNEPSRRMMEIVERLRDSEKARYQLVSLVRQGEQPREGFVFLSNLVEDQTGGSTSYVEWLLQIHRLVQQNA